MKTVWAVILAMDYTQVRGIYANKKIAEEARQQVLENLDSILRQDVRACYVDEWTVQTALED